MNRCSFGDWGFSDHIQLVLDNHLANLIRVVTIMPYKTKEMKKQIPIPTAVKRLSSGILVYLLNNSLVPVSITVFIVKSYTALPNGHFHPLMTLQQMCSVQIRNFTWY